MNTFQFISLLILAFGIYLIYSCVQLKVSGIPTKGVMVSGRFNLKNAKDLPGFIKYVYMKSLICGLIIFVLAVVSLFCTIYQVDTMITALLMVILLVVCMYYSKMISYAQQTYLLGLNVEELKARRKQMKEDKRNKKKGAR